MQGKTGRVCYNFWTLGLAAVAYPALAKPFNPAVLIELVRRLAGGPDDRRIRSSWSRRIDWSSREGSEGRYRVSRSGSARWQSVPRKL